jgi:NAD(P)-dependent dehydrogenase (short-subunit alcohol dehydrogenase family)
MQAAVAMEVGKYRIRVNTLSPAAVRSERMIKVMKRYAEEKHISLEEQIKIEESNYSLKRITEPEDIAKCVVFLASDDSISITNQTIACSSGLGLMASQVK